MSATIHIAALTQYIQINLFHQSDSNEKDNCVINCWDVDEIIRIPARCFLSYFCTFVINWRMWGLLITLVSDRCTMWLTFTRDRSNVSNCLLNPPK